MSLKICLHIAQKRELLMRMHKKAPALLPVIVILIAIFMSGSPYAHRSTHLKKAMYSFVLEQLSSALYVIIARTSEKSKGLFFHYHTRLNCTVADTSLS